MLSYIVKHFTDLTLQELYRILQLRQEVFVVEQDCPYLDADDKDQESYHVLGLDKEGVIHACTRLVPKGLSYEDYISIGRVVTSEQQRGKGEGVRLMEYSNKAAHDLWPGTPIKISAQSHLQKFYNSLGYVTYGEGYLEDGIPHVGMIKNK